MSIRLSSIRATFKEEALRRPGQRAAIRLMSVQRVQSGWISMNWTVYAGRSASSRLKDSLTRQSGPWL